METKPTRKKGWIVGIVVMAVLTALAIAADAVIFGLLWF